MNKDGMSVDELITRESDELIKRLFEMNGNPVSVREQFGKPLLTESILMVSYLLFIVNY